MSDVLNRTTMQLLKSVNEPDYPKEDWIWDPDLLAVVGVPSKYWKIVGDTISEMSRAEKDVVDAAGLPAYKIARYAAIDTRTEQLIAAGFTYGGKIFSLSANAQRSMNSNALNLPSFPVERSVKDDSEVVSFANTTELNALHAAAASTLDGHRDTGRAIKKTITAATTQAEVDAVVDVR